MSANEFEGNLSHSPMDIDSANRLIAEEGIEAKSREVDEPTGEDGLPKKLIINFSEGDGNECTLQDAFLRYNKKRQKELRRTRKRRDLPDEFRTRSEADPKQMWKLRMLFLKQAKKYFGTPYAKKYWTPQDPEYHSARFLDCCGLVRQVVRDLKKDFGFRIGPWNQSYLCDTLPVTIEKEEDMKPGDLVFISAIYNNTKSKKQKHNLTHVEIWLGDGPKTIGARWQRGKVQVFDSYQFNATSYHSPVYIFKSIDTWLMGICRSHCPEHTWKWRSEVFTPGKKSIFYATPQLVQDTQHEEGEGASDSEQELTRTSPQEAQRPQAELTEKDEVDRTECTMLHKPSSLSTRTVENDISNAVGLRGDTLLQPCQESHHDHETAVLRSSEGIVLKFDDNPENLDKNRESCFQDCYSDNNERSRSYRAQSPDSDCYESCNEQTDDHELNCDKNGPRDLLNCTTGDFSYGSSTAYDKPTNDPDCQNITTDIHVPSCLPPQQTVFEAQRPLQNFHNLSLYLKSADNSSCDAT